MISFCDFKNIFKHINKLCWENNCDDEATFNIALNHFINNKHFYSKNKNIIRLIGQSGSGKTTQLLPTAEFLMQKNNCVSFNACVRDYAQLHPQYKSLLLKYGKSEIREKTNCFALKCMLVNLAIENNYDIIFEVTILTKKFEKFVTSFLLKNNYNIISFCVAVNKKTSNMLINKRKNNQNSNENNRVVYTSSSNFFYKNLNKTIKFYIKKLSNKRVIVWNINNYFPFYDGNFKNCLKTFKNNQKVIPTKFNDEHIMLERKKQYVLKHIKLNRVK